MPLNHANQLNTVCYAQALGVVEVGSLLVKDIMWGQVTYRSTLPVMSLSGRSHGIQHD